MKKYKFLSKKEGMEVLNAYLNASEKTKSEVTLYEVSAYPDTNEGRYGAQKQGYVMVRCGEFEADHKQLFLMDFMFDAYGSPITFGMGGYSVPAWTYKEVELKGVHDFPLSSILYNLKAKELDEEQSGIFAPPVILTVIESINYQELRGHFIWSKWNHFSRKFNRS